MDVRGGIRFLSISGGKSSEERQHTQIRDIRKEDEDEELRRRRLQSSHEVENEIEEEDGDEFERSIDDVESEDIGGGSNHGELTVSNDDGTDGVGGGDFGETSERVVENSEEDYSTPVFVKPSARLEKDQRVAGEAGNEGKGKQLTD